KLRQRKRPSRVLDLIHQLHKGNDAESGGANFLRELVELAKLHSLADDSNRPLIALIGTKAQSVSTQIDHAAGRNTRDRTVSRDPQRGMDHAVAAQIEIA